MMTIVLYYTIGLLAAYTYHRTILFIVSHRILQHKYTRRLPFGTLVRHSWSCPVHSAVLHRWLHHVSDLGHRHCLR